MIVMNNTIDFQSIEYCVKEHGVNLNGQKLNNLPEVKIIGLNNALDKAKDVIQRAIRRKMSVLEQKMLKENLYYQLPAWQLTIEKI